VSSLELDDFRIDGGDGRDVGFGLGPEGPFRDASPTATHPR
jgi:hypothetical protein